MAATSSGDLIADRRYLYAEDALGDGDGIAARDLYAQTLERVPNWLPARFGLARALLLLGEILAAEAALEAILKDDPADILGVGAWLARLRKTPAPENALSTAYVARLFDDYAARFDSHLVEALRYCAPQLLANAITEIARDRRFNILFDLGCGTGLMPPTLAGRYTNAIGIDLSKLMLDQAAQKGFYTRLICADLTTAMLAEPAASADLVIAADVFCYINALKPVLEAAHHIMQPQGILAFTIQTHKGKGVVIGGDLRVHHAPDDVISMAQGIGLASRLLRFESSRMDAGKPVAGATLVFERL